MRGVLALGVIEDHVARLDERIPEWRRVLPLHGAAAVVAFVGDHEVTERAVVRRRMVCTGQLTVRAYRQVTWVENSRKR